MKKINTWFKQKHSRLDSLQRQLQDLHVLTTQVSLHLPDEWRPFCHVVRYDLELKTLIMSTSEQSLFTPLRFMQHQLLSQLRKKSSSLNTLEKIEFIYTPLLPATPREKHTLKLSKESAQLCQQAASKCPAPLQRALIQLSKTINSKISSTKLM